MAPFGPQFVGGSSAPEQPAQALSLTDNSLTDPNCGAAGVTTAACKRGKKEAHGLKELARPTRPALARNCGQKKDPPRLSSGSFLKRPLSHKNLPALAPDHDPPLDWGTTGCVRHDYAGFIISKRFYVFKILQQTSHIFLLTRENDTITALYLIPDTSYIASPASLWLRRSKQAGNVLDATSRHPDLMDLIDFTDLTDYSKYANISPLLNVGSSAQDRESLYHVTYFIYVKTQQRPCDQGQKELHLLLG